jgi:hypothetical protein
MPAGLLARSVSLAGAEAKKKEKKRRTYLPTFFEIF